MDFTLEPADAKWVQETMTKVTEELRQTTPNGRAFAETVQAILEREKNWVSIDTSRQVDCLSIDLTDLLYCRSDGRILYVVRLIKKRYLYHWRKALYLCGKRCAKILRSGSISLDRKH